MATNYVCKLCGSADPRFFTFATSGKIALCPEDLGKHMTQQGALGHAVLPIEAWEFVEALEDLPAYQQRSGEAKKCIQIVHQFIADEESDYRTAKETLAGFKQNILSIVESVFTEKDKELDSVHTEVHQRLQQCSGQFELWKLRKSAKLDDMSQKIAALTSAVGLKPYSRSIQDVSCKVRNTLESITATQKLAAPELIAESLKPTKATEVTAIQQVAKEPTLEKKVPCGESAAAPQKPRPTVGKCSVCGDPLSTTNFVHLPGHEDCKSCLPCIEKKNTFILTCPTCKQGYNEEAKEKLKKLLPNMFELMAKKRIQAVKNREKKGMCDACYNIKTGVHRCRNKKLCFDCWEINLAKNCFHHWLRCPECGVNPKAELAHRRKPVCFKCREKTKLTEVQHYCSVGGFLCGDCASESVLCKECSQKV